MTATRSRAEERTYKRHQKKRDNSGCEFCTINRMSSQFVKEGKYFKVIKNIFGYSLWDGQKVKDHLMLIPKTHVDSIDDLPKAAAVEFVSFISRYEKQGYNIYARAPGSAIKSIIHQHTHFIKTTGRAHRFVLLLRKPYIRLTFR